MIDWHGLKADDLLLGLDDGQLYKFIGELNQYGRPHFTSAGVRVARLENITTDRSWRRRDVQWNTEEVVLLGESDDD